MGASPMVSMAVWYSANAFSILRIVLSSTEVAMSLPQLERDPVSLRLAERDLVAGLQHLERRDQDSAADLCQLHQRGHVVRLDEVAALDPDVRGRGRVDDLVVGLLALALPLVAHLVASSMPAGLFEGSASRRFRMLTSVVSHASAVLRCGRPAPAPTGASSAAA